MGLKIPFGLLQFEICDEMWLFTVSKSNRRLDRRLNVFRRMFDPPVVEEFFDVVDISSVTVSRSRRSVDVLNRRDVRRVPRL